METVGLTALVRKVGTKGHLRNLRQNGQLPGILYGAEINGLPIQLPAKELERIVASRTGLNTLIRLQVEGEGRTTPMVMIKQVQRDPIGGKLTHVDLHQISLREKLHTDVPVILAGTPEGVNEGGILQAGIRTVEVECLPTGIPDNLPLDVSGMAIGDKLTAADLKTPEGVRVTTDPDTLLASVVPPRVEEEPAIAPEVAEPEPAEGKREETGE